jgi:hypothetical protein
MIRLAGDIIKDLGEARSENVLLTHGNSWRLYKRDGGRYHRMEYPEKFIFHDSSRSLTVYAKCGKIIVKKSNECFQEEESSEECPSDDQEEECHCCPGPEGPTGPRGREGREGERGPRGFQGFQGPPGPSGPSGSSVVGPSGPSGSSVVGPSGPSGSSVVGPSGPSGPSGSVTAARGIIPFSSGIVVPASITTSSPIVIGFGNNRVIAAPGLAGSPATTSDAMATQFAFSIPVTGTLQDLQVSVDAHFKPNTAQTLLTYTFTLYRSPSTISPPDTGLTAYATTGLTANATFSAASGLIFPTGSYRTASGNATGPANVTAGDRVVLYIVSNQATTPPALDEIAFSAAVTYA